MLTLADDGQMRLWDANDGQLIYARRAHTSKADRITISPDGATALVIRDDGLARLFNVEDGELRSDLPKLRRSLHAVAWNPVRHDQYLVIGKRTAQIIELGTD